jgi:hypothetical protein
VLAQKKRHKKLAKQQQSESGTSPIDRSKRLPDSLIATRVCLAPTPGGDRSLPLTGEIDEQFKRLADRFLRQL